jgi:hypothetical protein
MKKNDAKMSAKGGTSCNKSNAPMHKLMAMGHMPSTGGSKPSAKA